jgi:hypothetical protein
VVAERVRRVSFALGPDAGRYLRAIAPDARSFTEVIGITVDKPQPIQFKPKLVKA